MYSKEVDVWAFGCFAYQLATGKTPFHYARDKTELFNCILGRDVASIPQKWSDDFCDFVANCLKKDFR